MKVIKYSNENFEKNVLNENNVMLQIHELLICLGLCMSLIKVSLNRFLHNIIKDVYYGPDVLHFL